MPTFPAENPTKTVPNPAEIPVIKKPEISPAPEEKPPEEKPEIKIPPIEVPNKANE